MVEDVVHALHGPPTYLEPCRIAADETDAIAYGAQVLAPAGREVIEDGDVRAGAHEPLDEMRANESSTAGDEVAHARR